MSQVQSGILPEHCRAAIWIEANVKGEVDALRAASKTFADKLATFEAKFPDAHLGAVVAFGNNTWRVLYFLLLLAQVVLLCWQPWLWLNGESVSGIGLALVVADIVALIWLLTNRRLRACFYEVKE